MSYTPKHKIRIVTAASLFDGHDAAINIMRRILQSKGAEVIHLGHNRAAAEIVDCAIQEDAQGIAVTSYQGGHIEFFKYMYDLLKEKHSSHIKIFGGGGGTILPGEIEELHRYGIAHIYSPDDGRRMGLEGMIEDVISACDFAIPIHLNGELKSIAKRDPKAIAHVITLAENGTLGKDIAETLSAMKQDKKAVVLGVTGVGGAGKSSVTDELIRRFLSRFDGKTVAVVSVDPSKKKTGGALLGDRIRMNALNNPRAYMRSLATRESDKALSEHVQEAIDACRAAGFDLIILESAGVGQSDTAITEYCDVNLYVMTPEYGAASQLEKINMLDYADLVAVNKFDKAGAPDALHDVRKQFRRNHGLWSAKDDELPVTGTIAAQFNDAGVNELFERLLETVKEKCGTAFGEMHPIHHTKDTANRSQIIPPARVRYLAEITETIAEYDRWVEQQCEIVRKLYQLKGVIEMISKNGKT